MEEFPAGVWAGSDVERGLPGVSGGGVDVCSAGQEVFGDSALTAVTCLPECFVEIIFGGFRISVQQLSYERHLAECCGYPQRVDFGASFGEQAGCVPASVADGVGQGRADGSSGRFDVSSAVDQLGDDVAVVVAGCPVQGSLWLPPTCRRGVRVGACRDEQADNLRAVGEVTGPVGSDMQSGPGAALASGIRVDARPGWSFKSCSSVEVSPARIACVSAWRA